MPSRILLDVYIIHVADQVLKDQVLRATTWLVAHVPYQEYSIEISNVSYQTVVWDLVVTRADLHFFVLVYQPNIVKDGLACYPQFGLSE